LATELVESGHIRVNRERITKISHAIKPDDVLTIVLHNQVKVVKVLAEPEKRGSAPEARLLYLELNTEAAPQKMSAINQTLS
jgi:ribosome-associated heat shock protein Hsp15